jgi:hypothetical protein
VVLPEKGLGTISCFATKNENIASEWINIESLAFTKKETNLEWQSDSVLKFSRGKIKGFQVDIAIVSVKGNLDFSDYD